MILAALGAVLAAGCGGGDGVTAGSAELVTLTDVSEVAAAFDDDRGHPRLVLLLSPT